MRRVDRTLDGDVRGRRAGASSGHRTTEQASLPARCLGHLRHRVDQRRRKMPFAGAYQHACSNQPPGDIRAPSKRCPGITVPRPSTEQQAAALLCAARLPGCRLTNASARGVTPRGVTPLWGRGQQERPSVALRRRAPARVRVTERVRRGPDVCPVRLSGEGCQGRACAARRRASDARYPTGE